MTVQVLGWLALVAGNAGILLLPRTRHGWLLTLASGGAWAVVDVMIGLWPGLAGALLALAVNGRAWHRHVAGPSSISQGL